MYDTFNYSKWVKSHSLIFFRMTYLCSLYTFILTFSYQGQARLYGQFLPKTIGNNQLFNILTLFFPFPVNCKLSYFKEGPCSKTCGGGYKTFQRTVIQQATYGGKQCYGALSKTKSCNNQPCPGSTQLFTL